MAFWRDGGQQWVPGHWEGLRWVRGYWRKKPDTRPRHDGSSTPLLVLLAIIVLLYVYGAVHGDQLPRLFP